VPYVRLTFLLSFGMVGSTFFGAILGGAGDTTTPLFLTLLHTTVAITAEWLLIFGHAGLPALGVGGVALGIACGHVVGMSVGMTVLLGGRARVHLGLRHFAPDLRALARIARLSCPPALQMAGSVLVVYLYMRLAGDFGESVQAAYAIGLRVSMIVPMVCFPIASACATLVGQALGAGNVPRAWRAIRVALAVHGPLMGTFALVTFLFRTEIVALLSDDPEVVRVGADYLLWTSGSFALWAFYFVFLRALQGAGDFLVPMIVSLGSLAAVGVPAALLLTRTPLGESGIWAAQLASSAVSTTGTGLWLWTGRWTRRPAPSGAP